MAKCLHIVGDVDCRFYHSDTRRSISVQFVCGTDSNHGQAAEGMVSLNLSQEVARYDVTDQKHFVTKSRDLVVDGKPFVLKVSTPGEKQNTILVKKEQQNSSPASFGSSGVKLQTPFFPGDIQINTSTGLITVLPTNRDIIYTPPRMPSTVVDIPPRMPSTVVQPRPKAPAIRQFIPGMNIALLHCKGNFVCAECGGNGPLIANRTMIRVWETFAVVAADINGYENGIGLRSQANGKYVTPAADGMSLIASEASVSFRNFFVEVDAGNGKVALLSVHAEQYVGRATQLGLVPWLREWEMFVVKPVVNPF